jgi:hypothetical protein
MYVIDSKQSAGCGPSAALPAPPLRSALLGPAECALIRVAGPGRSAFRRSHVSKTKGCSGDVRTQSVALMAPVWEDMLPPEHMRTAVGSLTEVCMDGQ